MKLKLRRSQKSGLMGGVKFTLFAIVDLSSEERGALDKYKFGKTIIYQSPQGEAAMQAMNASGSARSVFGALSAKMRNQILSVNNLVEGMEITCDDIADMLGAEEQVIEACHGLSRILYACRSFGGEEVIDIQPFEPAAA